MSNTSSWRWVEYHWQARKLPYQFPVPQCVNTQLSITVPSYRAKAAGKYFYLLFLISLWSSSWHVSPFFLGGWRQKKGLSSSVLHLYCFFTPNPGSAGAVSPRLNKTTTIWSREASQDAFLSFQNCPCYFFYIYLFMLKHYKFFSWELKVILLPYSENQGIIFLKLLGLTFYLVESLVPMQSGIKTLLNKEGSALIICCSTPDSVSYARAKTQWTVNFEQRKVWCPGETRS